MRGCDSDVRGFETYTGPNRIYCKRRAEQVNQTRSVSEIIDAREWVR